MAKQNPLQHILTKPMDRRQFLQHVGLMFLAFFGATRVISHLLEQQRQDTTQHASRGWGGGKFGR